MRSQKYLEENSLEWLIQLYINHSLNKNNYFILEKRDKNSYVLLWKEANSIFCTVYRDAVIEVLKTIINEED